MNVLSTPHFFSLQTFAHAALFKGCTFPWEALGKIGDYLKTQTGTQTDAVISPDAYLVNPEMIFLGPGTTVEPGAYIEGPCLIGANNAIRHGAYLRGNVITGDGCVLGHATEVKNSIFLNNAKAAHFAYVGDSILGNGVNLGAGTRLANLRFDGKEIFLNVEGERMGTGRRKFGAILGDGSQTGCNAVCNPGTVAAPGAIIRPCKSTGGFLRSFSGAKS